MNEEHSLSTDLGKMLIIFIDGAFRITHDNSGFMSLFIAKDGNDIRVSTHGGIQFSKKDMNELGLKLEDIKSICEQHDIELLNNPPISTMTEWAMKCDTCGNVKIDHVPNQHNCYCKLCDKQTLHKPTEDVPNE